MLLRGFETQGISSFNYRSGSKSNSPCRLSKENPPLNNTPTDCPSARALPNAEEVSKNQFEDSSTNPIDSAEVESSLVNSPEIRRSTRVRKAVDRYGFVPCEYFSNL